MQEAGIAGIGFVVGALVGLTGMGGGALTTPVLIFWLGIRPVVAVGTDLVFLAVLKVAGVWAHQRWGNVDWRLVKLLAMGSVPGAILGLAVLSRLRGTSEAAADTAVMQMLGAVLIVVSLFLLSRVTLGERRFASLLPWGRSRGAEPRHLTTMALGLLVGFLVSMTSVGGGTLVVAGLLLFYSMDTRRVVGTDIAHALLLTTVAAMGHLGARTVNLPLVANLLVGAVPGILLGSRMTIQVPDRGLRVVIASLLLVAGLKLV